MKKLYYFAFGSNILLSRIQDRLGIVRKIGTYNLRGWKLEFNCGHWDCAYANIEPATQKDYVEGVLYELTPDEIWTLDHFEAVPHNYYKGYFAHPDGNIMFAYIATNDFKGRGNKRIGRPHLQYLNILIDGCVENGFKYTFNKLFEYKENNYEIVSNKHNKIFEENF